MPAIIADERGVMRERGLLAGKNDAADRRGHSRRY